MLSIVIPVHNRRKFTQACLAKLQCQTVKPELIIVVDDGSTDGTAQMVRSEFPDVMVVSGDGSLWWAGATTLGAQVALKHGATYVMTLNDDTLPEPAFVEKMLAAATEEPNALIGAYGVRADNGKPVFGGERMNWATASHKSMLRSRQNPRTGLVEVTHCPGRGLLIPAEVFRKIGFFDSKLFPQTGGDYDFAHRARRAGYRQFCNYSAPLGIYPEASGDNQNRLRKGWRSYYRHLFHVAGGGNLKVFFWYALRNCPKHLLPVCLPIGIARRILGFPKDWLLETVSVWLKRHAIHSRT